MPSKVSLLVFCLLLATNGVANAGAFFEAYSGRLAGVGSNTAISGDLMSSVSNPLWVDDSTFSLSIALGAGTLIVGDSIGLIEDVAETNFSDASSEIYSDVEAYNRLLADLQELDDEFEAIGAQGNASIGVGAFGFRLVVSRYFLLDTDLELDLVRIIADTDPANPLSFLNNTSATLFGAADIYRISVGYAADVWSFDTRLLGEANLTVGGNLNYLIYETYGLRLRADDEIFVDGDVSDLIDRLEETGKSSNAFDADLGVGLRFDRLLTLGLVATNVLSPDLEFNSDLPDYSIDPKVRLLANARFTNRIQVGLDIDLNKTESLTEAVDSQEVRLGSEFSLPIVPLRAGLVFDHQATVSAITAGFGFDIGPVSTNFGGLYSFGEDTYRLGFDLGVSVF